VGLLPALMAVAVKVTVAPAQIFVAEAVIVAVGLLVGLITTFVLPVSETQPLISVATAIQVPPYAEVTLSKTAVLVYWPPKPDTGFFIK
jgi:hypothetical protein